MMFYIKLVGVGLLLAGAFYISREYSLYLDKRLGEYKAISSMLSYAEEREKEEISKENKRWDNFSDEYLEKCGILSELRAGKDLFTILSESIWGLSISSEVKSRISNILSDLREKAVEEKEKALQKINSILKSEIESESELADKNRQIVRALLIGGALAVVVMLF